MRYSFIILSDLRFYKEVNFLSFEKKSYFKIFYNKGHNSFASIYKKKKKK